MHMDRTDYKQALSKALVFINYKDRTCHEVREKLSKEEYPRDTIDEVVEFLCNDGFLNDRRYAEYYVVCYENRRSKYRIKTELRSKGISDDIISEVLINSDESQAYEKALSKQLSKYGLNNIEEADYQTKSKIYASLYRQGYTVTGY